MNCPDSSEAIAGVCGQPWQTLTQNLGDAHITGLNVTVDYAPNDSWVIGMNYEIMEAETDSEHDFNEDGDPVNVYELIAQELQTEIQSIIEVTDDGRAVIDTVFDGLKLYVEQTDDYEFAKTIIDNIPELLVGGTGKVSEIGRIKAEKNKRAKLSATDYCRHVAKTIYKLKGKLIDVYRSFISQAGLPCGGVRNSRVAGGHFLVPFIRSRQVSAKHPDQRGPVGVVVNLRDALHANGGLDHSASEVPRVLAVSDIRPEEANVR